ncbi:MAG TPA: DNA/RNA non-specific endonuclease [Nitrosospira sp.]|nr:DNA/RNA non-specific endonuclease [Nitrosospira sp.]
MGIDLSYQPHLESMQRLRPAQEESSTLESVLEARRGEPRITHPEAFNGRDGYQEKFLGEFVVPWPRPTGLRLRDVQLLADGKDKLAYTHFSVMMSRYRRIAMCVGVNISGGESVKIERTPDKWAFDGRLPVEYQVGEDLYADNLLDRGHLVRREDPNWGPDAETANEDTFHFTNCSPQMAAFNQKTWLSLEDYILQNTRRWQERVTVFSGPVFRDSDREYRGVLIPSAYWKVIAFLSDDGKPSATAYMIDQSGELAALEAAFGRFKTYQRSIARIEELTDLDFGKLKDYDGFTNEERRSDTRIEAVINRPSDIRV